MKYLNFPTLTPLAADPGTPAAGTYYINTTTGLKWYGTAWHTAMDLETAQTVPGAKTFTGLALLQSAAGTQPMQIKARTTANGGQSGNLLEFTDASGNMQTNIDALGNYSSSVAVSAANVSAGLSLGSAGTVALNRIAPSVVGTQTYDSSLLRFSTSRWSGVDNVENFDLQVKRRSVTVGDAYLNIPMDVTNVGTHTATVGFTTGDGTANGILTLSQAGVTTAVTTVQNSSVLRFASARWTGSASVVESYDVKTIRRSSVAGDYYLNVPADLTSTGVLNSTTDVQVSARSLPRGYISGSYKQITANTGTFTAVTKIAGLSGIVVTLVSGRQYKVVVKGLVYVGTPPNVGQIYLYQGGAQIDQAEAWVGNSNGQSVTLERLVSGSGSVTFDVYTGSASYGSGISAFTTIPAQIWVEDIGVT